MVNLHLTVTMKILVITGFLSAFLITGDSLMCITCRGKFDCTGTAQTCPSPEDVCMTICVEIEIERKTKSYMYLRQCGHPKHCDQIGNITNAVSRTEISTKCCNENSCKPERPFYSDELLAYNKSSEDKRLLCPTCESRAENNCTAEYAFPCSDLQTKCIIRSETSDTGAMIIQGCATENFCTVGEVVQLLEGSNVKTICTIPTKNTSLQINHFRRCTVYTLENSVLVLNKLEGVLCSMDQDSCLREDNVITWDGKETIELMVKCAKSSECNRTGIIRHPDKTILFNTKCCYSDFCLLSAPDELVKINKTRNDLQCESCYSSRSSDRCLVRNKMKCMGNENSCIFYKAAITEGKSTTHETFYGCGTNNICMAGNRSVNYGTKQMEMEFTCLQSSVNKLDHVFQRSSPAVILLSYLMFICVFHTW